MARLSSLLIGVVAFSLVISLFTFGLSEFYTRDSTLVFNEGNFTAFNKLTEMNDLSRDIRNKTSDLTTESGTFDKLGAFFSSGYQVLKVSIGGVTTTQAIVEEGFSQVPMEEELQTSLKGAAVTMLLLAVFLGIIISALIKREM